VIKQWMWYTFALVLVFLVLSRWEAVNALMGTGGELYLRSVGVLQGRTVSGGTIGGIAR
jgi:hypothetical protein